MSIVRKPGETGADVLERVAGAMLPAEIVKEHNRATKLPRQIAAIVYMRMQGLTNNEIAEKMGVRPRRVAEIIYRARTEYNFSDIVDRVQHQAIPQAIENLNDMLDQGDREATFETLKGTGVFRKHVVGKDGGGGSVDRNTLKVEISLPEGMSLDSLPPIAIGSILANPRSAPSKTPAPALPAPTVETVDAL